MKDKIIKLINGKKESNQIVNIKFIWIACLISIVFVILAFLSRFYNIFRIDEHSYFEHFVYTVFGNQLLTTILLFFSYILRIFIKDIKDIKISFVYLISTLFIITISYLTEFHRNGPNLVNHFYFDTICAILFQILIFYLYKNKFFKVNKVSEEIVNDFK